MQTDKNIIRVTTKNKLSKVKWSENAMVFLFLDLNKKYGFGVDNGGFTCSWIIYIYFLSVARFMF